MLGRVVVAHSPARLSKPPKKRVAAAMREVHENEPSTVTRAKHFGSGGKEAMLRAIAFSKARKRR